MHAFRHCQAAQNHDSLVQKYIISYMCLDTYLAVITTKSIMIYIDHIYMNIHVTTGLLRIETQ